MSGNKRKDFSINTIIGPNTSVYGDLESGGFTRVDGNLRGNLTAQGQVIVGEKARIKSNISGTSVTIGGVVYGDILASERLIVLSTGLVLGDIVTRRIQADEGCLIHGKVTICETDQKWNQVMTELQAKPEIEPVSPVIQTDG
ncbi:MAG: polymer-forming cytoskeletal protein [Spirochaetaceae bacterium]|jgi:cytoskeletal protein CcmA (bactofilin family)|nr:polymer-forming cytoskeletal protein [Spirochaetaceae bacterium]